MDPIQSVSLYLATLQDPSICTASTYRSALNRFTSYLPDPHKQFPTDPTILAAWRAWLADTGLGPSSQRTYRQIVCAWLDWCVLSNYLPGHSLRSIKVDPPGKPHRPKVSRKRFIALLDACAKLPDPFQQVRARAMLYVAFTAMLRIRELLSLRTDNLFLDDEPPRLYVEKGKNRKSAWLPLSDDCADALRAWLKMRSKLDNPRLWVHSGPADRPMEREAFYNLLGNLAKMMDYKPEEVKPHAFRRGGATAMLQGGIDIGTVSKALRHASIRTTEIYVEADAVRLADVRNWMEAVSRGAHDVQKDEATSPERAAFRLASIDRCKAKGVQRHRLPPANR